MTYLDRAFEDMRDPPLADRLRAFETWLENEPCQNDGGCVVMSVSRRMCAPCRLRLRFHHCLYNAEAYEGGPGEIPRAVIPRPHWSVRLRVYLAGQEPWWRT